jgi:hypothetical protein
LFWLPYGLLPDILSKPFFESDSPLEDIQATYH